MNKLPLHPALVHLPIGVAIVVPIVLLALTVALVRGRASRGTFWVAALLQGVVVAGGMAAFLSGGAEEDRVERIVAKAAIEHHESLAIGFLGAAFAVLSLIAATVLAPERLTRALAGASIVSSAGALVLGLVVGHAGGELVYVLGAGAAYVTPAVGAPTPAGQRQKDHD